MKQLGSTCLCVVLVFLCASAFADSAGTTRTEPRIDDDDFHQHPAVQRARAFTMWMAIRSDSVHQSLWEARFRRDTARMQCLDRRLSQLHAIERSGRSSQLAVEAAVRADALTGPHMVRLVNLHDASRRHLRAAERCGRQVSERARLPTRYTVRVTHEPVLPEAPRLDSASR